jgi:hypothetical protein
MKIEYRARRAKRQIQENLETEYRKMAQHAIEYLGKEFNTTLGWELKGRIYGLRLADRLLFENGIYTE